MKVGSVTSGLSLCKKGWEFEKQELDCRGHLGSREIFAGNTLHISWAGL